MLFFSSYRLSCQSNKLRKFSPYIFRLLEFFSVATLLTDVFNLFIYLYVGAVTEFFCNAVSYCI